MCSRCCCCCCCCCCTEVDDSSSKITDTNTLTPNEDEVKKQKNNVENSVIIWLNPTPTHRETVNQNKEQLKKQFYAVLTYSDPTECEQRIAKIKNDKVFLILSGEVKKNFVTTAVKDLSQIDSIYQYSFDEKNSIDYSASFPAVHKPQKDLNELCTSIKADIKICDKNFVGYAFLDEPVETSSTHKKKENDKDLNRQSSARRRQPRLLVLSPENDEITANPKEVPFMYLQLFKEIILNFKEDEHIHDTFAVINKNYKDNNDEMTFLDQLKRYYPTKTAAYWYTRESCLYRMVNKALRTNDYNELYHLRTFIRHLHEQLVVEHKTARQDMILYRGQAFDKIELSPPPSAGKLICFSNFLSTSLDESVARKFAFAEKTLYNPHLTTFLIKIKVNKNNAIPFANIGEYSAYDTESEWLFTIGSIFRIISIRIPTQTGEIGHMELELIDIHDPQLTALQQHLRSYLEEKNNYMNMARFMYHVGNWEKAIFFYDLALKDESDWQRRVAILNNIGSAYMQTKELDNALKHYQKVLQIEQRNQQKNYSGLASTYNNLGTVYYNLGDIDQADDYFKKAIKSHDNDENKNQELTATIFSNIGFVLNNKHKHEEALICFQKSVIIRINIYPDVHPSLAVTYNGIAVTCLHLGRTAREKGDIETEQDYYQRAIEYARKAIDLDEKSLPKEHPQTELHKKNLEYFEQSAKLN